MLKLFPHQSYILFVLVALLVSVRGNLLKVESVVVDHFVESAHPGLSENE